MLKHAALLLMDRSRWGKACDRDTEAHVTCVRRRAPSGTFTLMIWVGRNGFQWQTNGKHIYVSNK